MNRNFLRKVILGVVILLATSTGFVLCDNRDYSDLYARQRTEDGTKRTIVRRLSFCIAEMEESFFHGELPVGDLEGVLSKELGKKSIDELVDLTEKFGIPFPRPLASDFVQWQVDPRRQHIMITADQ
jgi:hypothetical protein